MNFVAGHREHQIPALLMVARNQENAFHPKVLANQLECFDEKVAGTHAKGSMGQLSIYFLDLRQFSSVAALHRADMRNEGALLKSQREGERKYPRVSEEKIEDQRPLIREPSRIVENETQMGMDFGNPANLNLPLGKRVEQPAQFAHRLIMRVKLVKARTDIPVRRLIRSDEQVEDIGSLVDEPSQRVILAAAPKLLEQILMLPSRVEESDAPCDSARGWAASDFC